MLGNIQFIGYLYRNRMLTENIMHRCRTAVELCSCMGATITMSICMHAAT